MRRIDWLARTLAIGLLIAAWTDSNAQEFAPPNSDGWHVWQVEAPQDDAQHCCYRFNDGALSMPGCDLDGGGAYTISRDDCELDDSRISVYVRITDGSVTRIRALNASCPVSTKTPVNAIGDVDGQASAAWLLQQVEAAANRRIVEDAMAAISAHEANIALRALTGILEDRSRRQKTREQALFWLAQIESDAAFDYIDALLGST